LRLGLKTYLHGISLKTRSSPVKAIAGSEAISHRRQIASLEAEGGKLVMKGKVFGSMPMTAKLTPQEARDGLKLLNFRLALFLLTFIFRR
jgi:hypothetical protein